MSDNNETGGIKPLSTNLLMREYAPDFYPRGLAEVLFQHKAAREQHMQECFDAIHWLESHGVVTTSGFFWHRDSGETLLEAVKRRHAQNMEDEIHKKGIGA